MCLFTKEKGLNQSHELKVCASKFYGQRNKESCDEFPERQIELWKDIFQVTLSLLQPAARGTSWRKESMLKDLGWREREKKNYLGKEKGLKLYSQKERGKEWISGDFATI